MPRLDPKKRKQAYRLRLQRKSLAEIARTLHMAPATLRKLEYGWVDKKGVRHRGWQDEIERLWQEEQKAELECGLALKEERVKALKRIAQQAIDKVEHEFPEIAMKNPSDWKTLVSEIRELIRLLSDEVGGRHGPARTATLRAEITLEEVQQAYEEARTVEAEVVALPGLPVPAPATPDEEETSASDEVDADDAEAEDTDDEGTDAGDADRGEEDADF